MLPLPSVSFDIYLTEDELVEGKDFPPTRFKTRDDRFNILDDLYESDFKSFATDDRLVAIPISLPRRLVVVQADMLMMSPIEVDYPLRSTASACIRDMLAYGGACILAMVGADGPMITSVSPLSWYPIDGGGAALMRTYISADADIARPDMIEITIVKDGFVEERHHKWSGWGGTYGQINEMVSSEVIGQGELILSPRSPEVGIWGESMYVDLASPLFELAKRYTQNSRILDKNANPKAVWTIATDDARERFGIPVPDPDAAQEEMTEQYKTMQKAAQQLRSEIDEDIILPDDVISVAYLEFSGNIDASFKQIQLTRELVSMLSGLPAVLDGLSQPPPSGVSLRLQYLPFYASTSALQKDLQERLGLALETVGLDGNFEWPHIFEMLDAESHSRAAERSTGRSGNAIDSRPSDGL